MSKSLKQVVGVVAAIALPFAAPAIAGSIGLSGAISSALGASAATGAAIGGGLTGAALGAGLAAAQGQDVGRGALFGALGGGVGGYTNPGATVSGLFGGGTAAPASAQGATTAAGTTAVPTDIGAADLTSFPSSSLSAGQPSGLTAFPTSLTAGQPSIAMVGNVGEQPGLLSRLGSTLGITPETLRRGGLQLAAGGLAGSGMPPGYEAALAEQRRARQMNERYAAERMAAAERLMNQARYFDPEYMGLQSAREAQLRAARATQAGLTGTTGERRETERRRGLLETARQTGSAYDVGYGQGARTQAQLTASGAGLIPTSYPTTMGDYSSLANIYASGEDERRRRAGDIGEFFGGLTDEEKKTGDEEKAG